MKRDQSRYINAILNVAEKFCSGCYRFRITKGGKWKVAVSGKTRRWICINCYNKITRR